jgi:hypothetical protein
MKTKTRAHRKLLEKDVEQYLCRQVERLGGKAYKFSSPANRAVPDRICCFPGGQIVFVECKAPGKHPTPLQLKVLKFLNVLGNNVAIIDSKEKVDTLIKMVKEDMQNGANEQ